MFFFVVRTGLVLADECCMKIILLVITGNFLSGSFRFVGALESICFCVSSGLAVVASHGTSRHLSSSLPFPPWQLLTPVLGGRSGSLCPDVDFLSRQGITEALRLPPSRRSSSSPGSRRMSVQGNGLGMKGKAKDRNVLLCFPLKL